jgi:hypothetical protein
VITAADGERWKVSRRWTSRRGRLDRWWRFRKPRKDGDGFKVADIFEPLDYLGGALDGGLAGIAVVVVFSVVVIVLFALTAFIILPILGVALEIAILVTLISSGVLGRVVLRRPWIIDVQNADRPELSRTYEVKGWLRSRRAIDEIKGLLVSGGLPALEQATDHGA